jgi:hypothetical protein
MENKNEISLEKNLINEFYQENYLDLGQNKLEYFSSKNDKELNLNDLEEEELKLLLSKGYTGKDKEPIKHYTVEKVKDEHLTKTLSKKLFQTYDMIEKKNPSSRVNWTFGSSTCYDINMMETLSQLSKHPVKTENEEESWQFQDAKIIMPKRNHYKNEFPTAYAYYKFLKKDGFLDIDQATRHSAMLLCFVETYLEFEKIFELKNEDLKKNETIELEDINFEKEYQQNLQHFIKKFKISDELKVLIEEILYEDIIDPKSKGQNVNIPLYNYSIDSNKQKEELIQILINNGLEPTAANEILNFKKELKFSIPGNRNQSLKAFGTKDFTFIPERIFSNDKTHFFELENETIQVKTNNDIINKYLTNKNATIDHIKYYYLEKLNINDKKQIEEIILDVIKMIHSNKILILDTKTLESCKNLDFIKKNKEIKVILDKLIKEGDEENYKKNNPWIIKDYVYGVESGNYQTEDFKYYKSRKSVNMKKI